MRTNRGVGRLAALVMLLAGIAWAGNPPVAPDGVWLKADQGAAYRADGYLMWTNQTSGHTDKKFYTPGPTVPNAAGGYSALVPNALNGQPVVSFSTNYCLSEHKFTQWSSISNIFGAGGTVFLVLNPSPAVTTGARRLLNTCQQTTTGWELYYSASADKIGFTHHFSGGAGAWETAAVFGKGAYHLLTFSYDNRALANDPTFRRNGRPVTLAYDSNPASGTANTEGASSMWVAIRSYTGWTESFSGSIAEIMIYRSVLSESQRHGVEVYLGDKYGLDVPHWGTLIAVE